MTFERLKRKITVYVTACDLEKSFICEKMVEFTSHVLFPIYGQTYST